MANILRDAGYLKQRQAYCVAVAQPVDPAEMLNPGRARRLIDAMDVHLDGSSGRRLIDVRDHKVVMIVSMTRRVSGWTAPRTSLASRIKTELATVGNAVFIGISNDVPSISYLPGAYEEARLALDCADLAHRVVQLSKISVRQLLLRFSGKGIRRLLPHWSGAFFEADRRSDGAMALTLRVYAGADMNVLRTAKVLDVHPNTVYARLEKITEITDLDPRSFHALTEMLIVVDCRDDPMTSPTASASKVS